MIRLSCSYADYQGALEDCDAVLKANEAAAGDALLLAFLTRAQCYDGLGRCHEAVDDYTKFLDATTLADAETALAGTGQYREYVICCTQQRAVNYS